MRRAHRKREAVAEWKCTWCGRVIHRRRMPRARCSACEGPVFGPRWKAVRPVDEVGEQLKRIASAR